MFTIWNSIWISWDCCLQVARELPSFWLLKKKGGHLFHRSHTFIDFIFHTGSLLFASIPPPLFLLSDTAHSSNIHMTSAVTLSTPFNLTHSCEQGENQQLGLNLPGPIKRKEVLFCFVSSDKLLHMCRIDPDWNILMGIFQLIWINMARVIKMHYLDNDVSHCLA